MIQKEQLCYLFWRTEFDEAKFLTDDTKGITVLFISIDWLVFIQFIYLEEPRNLFPVDTETSGTFLERFENVLCLVKDMKRSKNVFGWNNFSYDLF